jgi:hypothetical protein
MGLRITAQGCRRFLAATLGYVVEHLANPERVVAKNARRNSCLNLSPPFTSTVSSTKHRQPFLSDKTFVLTFMHFSVVRPKHSIVHQSLSAAVKITCTFAHGLDANHASRLG